MADVEEAEADLVRNPYGTAAVSDSCRHRANNLAAFWKCQWSCPSVSSNFISAVPGRSSSVVVLAPPVGPSCVITW